MTPEQNSSNDNSQQYTQADFAIGDTVIDREQGDPDIGVVVNRPPMAAEEWEAYRSDGEVVTVADDNPDYEPTSKVVVVMYPGDIEEWGVEWDAEEPLSLKKAPQGTAYAFPPNRLNPVGTYSSDGKTEATEPSQADDGTRDSSSESSSAEPAQEACQDEPTLRERLDLIADEVAELNVDDVAIDTFREVVVVEKLGEQYQIDVKGCVNADDPLAQRLEEMVSEQLEP
jgi:hypothetical protein